MRQKGKKGQPNKTLEHARQENREMQSTEENLQGNTKTWRKPSLILKQKHNTARNTHPKKAKWNKTRKAREKKTYTEGPGWANDGSLLLSRAKMYHGVRTPRPFG